jgi:polyphosphate glucokinase
VSEKSSLIGIDVGGSGIKGAIVDPTAGNAHGRIRIDTPQPSTPDAVAKVIAEVVDRLDCSGPIGCTFPAVVTGGVVRTAANIDKSWIGTNAVSLVTHATGRQCAAVNDADAAGIAEARFGAAAGRRGLVVVVTVGTGLGTALISDGLLVPNAELGHLEIDGHDADAWASDSARERKKLGWRVWAERLDLYLTRLHDLLWPELIVIGGGVVKHADKFFDLLDPGCAIRVAELGNLAGIVGAALVADEHAPRDRE